MSAKSKARKAAARKERIRKQKHERRKLSPDCREAYDINRECDRLERENPRLLVEMLGDNCPEYLKAKVAA